MGPLTIPLIFGIQSMVIEIIPWIRAMAPGAEQQKDVERLKHVESQKHVEKRVER